MTLIRCTLVALVWWASWAFAQATPPSVGFQHITVLDGLSQNAVHAIAQDRHGFLWFATEDGLNRYDGYSFAVYRRVFDTTVQLPISALEERGDLKSPGLTDSLVRVLYVDSDGVVWAGTANGLNRYLEQSDAWQHYWLSVPRNSGVTPFSVQAIAEDQRGRLWIGASPGGLVQLDRSTGVDRQFSHDPENTVTLSSERITSLVAAPDGWLWVGTGDAGLNRLHPETGEVQRYSHHGQRLDVVSGSQISALTLDHRGMLWIATEDAGLSRLDPATGAVQRFRHDPQDPESLSSDALRTVFEDSQRKLWIGHRPNGGLDQFDPDTGRFVHHLPNSGDELSLSDAHVLSAFEDTSGILWFGTSVGGVNKLDSNHRRFRHYQHQWWAANSLSDNVVRAFHQESHRLYIGTAGGLNVTVRQTHLERTPGILIVGVHLFSSGHLLWIQKTLVQSCCQRARRPCVDATHRHFASKFWRNAVNLARQ